MPLTWSPVDLAAVDFSKITLGQIALMFGVPGIVPRRPDRRLNTYANVESRFIEFKQLALQQWIVSAEAVLTAQLPLGDGAADRGRRAAAVGHEDPVRHVQDRDRAGAS